MGIRGKGKCGIEVKEKRERVRKGKENINKV